MSLVRQSTAEGVGTAFLVMAVIGSGIAAQRLSPGQAGLQLLINSIATGAALSALIVALQPVSASFNPIVTLAERALGAISTRQALVLVGAQLGGGIAGAVLANLMFDLPVATIATTNRFGAELWIAESVATLGLLLLIFGAVRSGRSHHVGYVVGGYITAAYWFTSSTSFANPAVTIARTLTDTFSGIAPVSVPMFLLAQLVGGTAAVLIISRLFPATPGVAGQPVLSVTEARDRP